MAATEVKLKPWLTPNFATIEMPPRPKQEGISALPSIPVKELSPQALADLAEQWLTELYEKAGKPRNWTFTAPGEPK